MEKENDDKIVYKSVIAACLIGIAIVSYSIATSPKYHESYTELYFYGEKSIVKDGAGTIMGKEFRVIDGAIFIDENGDADFEKGPFYISSTFLVDGHYWNIEDISKDFTEVMFRKF
ncbi:MAG: hypothetical protein ACXQTP_07105, partial [Candidatus Methanofastidiosia archaeon]